MGSRRARFWPWSREAAHDLRQRADELEATADLHRDRADRAGLPAAPPPLPWPAGAQDTQLTRPGEADVTVRVLGPLEVLVAGAPVAGWGGQRTRTLFQYLLTHRRPVHREVLMDLLWPGHTYTSARNNLNVCLYDLRRVLDVTSTGTRYVVYRDASYSLNRALRWDIDRDLFVAAAERARRCQSGGRQQEAIVALERAASAYGGQLFDGDQEADWFAAERTALDELFHQVLERLATLHAARGDLDSAQRVLELLLLQDGCRESAHRLMMSCFARRGQRDLVARQFQRCVARLDTELDITPSEETVDLFRILTGARQGRAWAAPGRAPAAAERPRRAAWPPRAGSGSA